jgi:hypothetical protein
MENKDSKSLETVAREYVDKQLETMKKYGSAPRDISPQKYQSLVRKITETLQMK